jgi:hypothetical protein
MKKHILSKKCWCKPDVISFRKENEENLSDKIFAIAALFNDSMDNTKYNKIKKILESLQMETEVQTGLKNFKVTMEELELARREIIEKLEDFEKEVNVYDISKDAIDDDNRMLRGLIDKCRKLLATLREKEGQV